MSETGGSYCRFIPIDTEYPKMPLVFCEIIKIEIQLVPMRDTLGAVERPLMPETGRSRSCFINLDPEYPK